MHSILHLMASCPLDEAVEQIYAKLDSEWKEPVFDCLDHAVENGYYPSMIGGEYPLDEIEKLNQRMAELFRELK